MTAYEFFRNLEVLLHKAPLKGQDYSVVCDRCETVFSIETDQEEAASVKTRTPTYDDDASYVREYLFDMNQEVEEKCNEYRLLDTDCNAHAFKVRKITRLSLSMDDILRDAELWGDE